MAEYDISFDCSAPDLLCNEETKCFFFDDDDDLALAQPFNDQSPRSNDRGLEICDNLPCLSEQCVCWMVEREGEHLPRDDYEERLRSGDLDVSLRGWALGWMLKACARHSYGETCLYAAMSYFDRFLSVYEFPKCSLGGGDRNWVTQLISVACLSLAAKIEEVNVPTTVAFQAGGEPMFLFEGKTIQRMEFLILNRLDWKVKPYTPYNFIDFYLKKMNNDECPSWLGITRSLDIITRTIEDIEFLKFRPSEIASAVAVFVSVELLQPKDADKSLCGLVGIDKGRLEKCLELIKNLAPISGIIKADSGNVVNGSSSSSSSSSCLSYKTVEWCPSSSHTKRRKLQ